MKRQRFFSSKNISFFEHEVVPYLLSSSLGSHVVFFRSLISSQSLGNIDHVSEEEDEP
jgi:hypothetical protein